MTPYTLAKSGTEHAEQRALMAWCNMAAKFGFVIADDDKAYTSQGYAAFQADRIKTYHASKIEWQPLPQLEWLHAIHNQEKSGSAIRGAMAKAEGVKAGVADLFLPWPKMSSGSHMVTDYHGLYIEMKRNVTTDIEKLLSEEQKTYRDYCQIVGYDWHCCRGWRNGRAVLLDYLGVY